MRDFETRAAKVFSDLRVRWLARILAKSAVFSAWYKYLQISCRPPREPSRGDHFARCVSNRRLSVPGCRISVADHSLVAARGVVCRVFPGRPVGSPGCSPSRNAGSTMVRDLVRRPRWWLRRLHDFAKRTTSLTSETALETSGFTRRGLCQSSRLAPKNANPERARQNV